MKKLLIVKTGGNSPVICNKYGDFEYQFMKVLGLKEDAVKVWTAYAGEEKPDVDDVYAIIITGSYSMVTDYAPWSLGISDWLREIEHRSIPTLGVCYGHQILAYTFGGKVGYHPEGKEYGTVRIELTEAGRKDPLLSVLPTEFLGHVAHSQTIITLPENAINLAKNNFESHHAFALNGHIWGLQYHPEFDANYILAIIDESEESLRKDGYNINKIKSSVQEISFGKALLSKFIGLAKKNKVY